MPNFPNSIYSPRAKENKAGVIYDPAKKTVGYVEDVTKLDDEVVAIENEFGLLPKATSASVSERLKGLRSLSDSNVDVLIIKVGNVGIGTTAPASGLHIKGSYPTGYLTVERTGVNGAGAANVMSILTDAKTANDTINLDFGALDSGSVAQSYGSLRYKIIDPTAGSEDSEIQLWNYKAGANTQVMTINNLGNVGIGTTDPTALLDINSNILRLRTAKTPASAGAAGNAGDICWDANFIYICVATNTWKRVAIATW